MFSIVFPMDANRLEQFKITKRTYDAMKSTKEFVIPTRSYDEVNAYLVANRLNKDVRLVPYEWNQGFNPSMGLNIGVRESKYDQIIITSPEVKPMTDVLAQLKGLKGKNIVCEVSDQDEDGNLSLLVADGYRMFDPGMYFLAMFNKSDLEKINGWDEEFMHGYAYEDNDFGARWSRAGLPFEFHSEIKAMHQYHPRKETISGGLQTNCELFTKNTEAGVVFCNNGLVKRTATN